MLNLPNLLTLIRIAFIPVLFVLLYFPGKLAGLIAASCFTIASITDFLDGFIARKRNSVTRIGKILDPMADKLLVTVCLIMLVSLHDVSAGIVTIIVCREILITGLRGIAAAEGIIIPAANLGKKKMVLQIVAIIALLLHYEYFKINFHQLGMILLILAMILTVWSGFSYCYRFSREILRTN